MAELAYQVRRAFVVLDFGVPGQEEVFLRDHFYRESERLKKRVGDLVHERDMCLEEVYNVSNSFIII